jgi:tryptophan halogenase
MTAPLDHIVIVGGGTSGWMTAAALAHFLRGAATKITLVESDDIGTVGVGEATLPSIIGFNKLLGINEPEFMRATQGTFKLGIQFVNWGRKDATYFHPFGSYGQKLDICDFHHYWLRARQAGLQAPLDDYCLNAVLARQNLFSPPVFEPGSPLSTLTHAYHFDAGLYARYLRTYAEARGVTRIEGRIGGVTQDANSGFVTSVTLDSGQTIGGDLFIDCSGFRGLLIEETLKTGYIDWSQRLPCNRAVAVPSERSPDFTPYTRSTAREAGWQWRIPLQHRTGNGYVYCSEYISDDEATRTLMDNLDGKPLADPRLLRFVTGRRALSWNKNVVAIGLSAGFLEPLESTSIHLIQKAILKLIRCMPDKNMAPELVSEFNRQLRLEYEDTRDFISLHYKATERDDTPFWTYNRTNTVSDSLRARMELFAHSGRLFINDGEAFALTSWVAVMMGQGIMPKGYDTMADILSLADTRKSLNYIRDAFARTAAAQMRHADFVAKHI